MRLDNLLLEKHLFSSKSKAQTCIRNGFCSVNGRIITKCGYEANIDDIIDIKEAYDSYVSFGGYKLEKALNDFKISLNNKTVLDIGASTGGFTDCCLKHGAKFVYAYDVGHNQLHFSLKSKPNIKSIEGINARYLKKDEFDKKIDFICMDVSFISCTTILPNISEILSNQGEAVILFKPQFEVGHQYLNTHGVVINKDIVKEKLNNCIQIANDLKLKCLSVTDSVVKEKNGNQEYLLYFVKGE